MGSHIGFEKVLKSARLAEAAHYDALENIRDARSLRLMALRESVLPEISKHAYAAQYIELVLQPGETPRLWLDLISFVTIAPDTRNFRLEQERNNARELVYESDDIDDMRNHVLRYLAHRMVARDKSAAGLVTYAPGARGPKYGPLALAYVWFTGLMFGALGLLLAAILTGRLKF